ncbi:unnamed protein product [Lactuca saligna]|uniref:Uncharacterized protein n=1 Tax=Lactuca saligna TaxID=75948 RepID=A0AA36E7Z4_LACSI|nr:unnamed protein product [Lactuca saligna]
MFSYVLYVISNKRNATSHSRGKTLTQNKLKRNGIVGTIDNTPLIRITSLSDILAKANFLNPGGSVKDRVVVKIIKENYSFIDEYYGPNDIDICGNTIRNNGFIQDSVRHVVLKSVTDALTNVDYFAREFTISGTGNESFYVMANYRAHYEGTGLEIWERQDTNYMLLLQL